MIATHAREQGVLAFGLRTIRAIIRLRMTREQCGIAAEILFQFAQPTGYVYSLHISNEGVCLTLGKSGLGFHDVHHRESQTVTPACTRYPDTQCECGGYRRVSSGNRRTIAGGIDL